MTIGWAKEIIRQCQVAGVPAFVKQLGSKPVNREGVRHAVTDSHGENIEEFPEVLRVRQFPGVR
jgi:protein gp37